MSEEKNTKMPEDFDMSIAEDLGKGSNEANITEAPIDYQNEPQTDNNTSVNSQITDAITQANTEVFADAPDLAMETLYETAANPNEFTGSLDGAPTYNIYEDLTHDHAADDSTSAAEFSAPVTNDVTANDMENVVWETEAQMDSHFDGNTSVSESEDLNT